VRADRNLTLAAQDQINVLDLHFWIGYDPVNQDRRISAHCRALPFMDDYRST
jgi:hypothetical protein